MGGEAMTRREALVTIGKAAAGVAVVTAAAAGLGGYYLEAQSAAASSASLASSSTTVEPGFTPLFDGATLDGWQQAGPGGFTVVDGMLQSSGGMGLLWYTKKQFGDFVLKVDWKVLHIDDNSGVFLRFPDPGNDPWVAVNNGYEVQIDDVGAPDGAMIHKTGGIYNFAAPTKVATNPVGDWNSYEIHAVGQSYRVILNGSEVTDFTGSRSTTGYVGLQNHNGTVTFRSVRIMEL
jgi:3-keto-disaccharide hydrolase